MIYKNIPKKFKPRFEIASCYMEYAGKILLLHRHNHKSEGGRWGVPAGKIDNKESQLDAMVREIKEETGQDVSLEQLEYLTKVYVKYPEYDFIYHMFRAKLNKKPQVVLNEREHKAFKWASPKDTIGLELVRDLGKCIKMFYEI